MIDPAIHSAPTPRMAPQGHAASATPRPIFRMIENDRMAGSVPAWIRPDSPQDAVVANLTHATTNTPFGDEMSGVLAYQANEASPQSVNDEPFGFGDVIDIINPLHHIPLVGTLYRHISGDQIRPSSQILGGTLFGGVLGAASGIANAIIEEETGADMGEHALQIAGLEPDTNHNPFPPSDAQNAAPVTQLAAAETSQYRGGELPANALSFVDLSYIEPAAGHEATNHPTKSIPAKPSALAAQYRFND